MVGCIYAYQFTNISIVRHVEVSLECQSPQLSVSCDVFDGYLNQPLVDGMCCTKVSSMTDNACPKLPLLAFPPTF